MQEMKDKEEINPTEINSKMTEASPSLLVNSLNVNGANSQMKDKDWQNEFLKIIQLYAAYKEFTLDLKT